MLYEINKEYYIRVGRRFIKVDVVVKNNDLDITPHKPTYEIEDNGNIKYKIQNVDDDFKKKISSKKEESFHNEEEKPLRHRR